MSSGTWRIAMESSVTPWTGAVVTVGRIGAMAPSYSKYVVQILKKTAPRL
jgi:hypothetical protein